MAEKILRTLAEVWADQMGVAIEKFEVVDSKKSESIKEGEMIA